MIPGIDWLVRAARFLGVVGLFCVCASTRCAAAELPARAVKCLVFETLMHAGKPDLRRHGIEPIEIAYEAQLWNPGAAADSYPDLKKVLSAAHRAAMRQSILVLDIERWPVEAGVTDRLVEARIEQLQHIVGWIRGEYPHVRLGYFGLMPSAAVTWALAPAESSDGIAWRRANARLDSLAASVDVVLPSLYTYSNDPDRWVRVAVENIRQARRYGKPVYAFVWPKYSERNTELAYQYVGDDFWRLQLETVCRHADGVVLWGGWDPVHKRPERWSREASWWLATQRFLAAQSEASEAHMGSR